MSAYRFNHSQLPEQLRLGTFDQERSAIYKEIVRLINKYELSSADNWFPLNNLLQRFKQIYSFQIQERQELAELLLQKVPRIRSVVGLQNAFSLICTIIQNKQKYFRAFQVNWRDWHQFLEDRFMTNKDKRITSQTYSIQMFQQFCQLLKTLKYFFKPDALDFGFRKFKEHMASQDKQAAWAYLMLFVPFRSDIPREKYEQIIAVIMDPLLQCDKDNCRLKFILNFLRVHPTSRVPNLVPQMMRFFHGYWRGDLVQEEKNEKLVNMLLPDETLGVPSLFKIMPQLMVELIGSSKREGYQEYMSVLKTLFSMIDSITNVYSQQSWDDQIFKLIKLLVGNFIFKYRRDQLLRQITELRKIEKHDPQVSKLMLDDLIRQFHDIHIQDFIDSQSDLQELVLINPDQGYSAFLQNYPTTQYPKHDPELDYRAIDLTMLLDEQAKEDFIAIVMSVMDKILYMEDQGYSTAKTVLYLSCFEPRLIEVFLAKMKQVMHDVTALPFLTLKSILIFLTIPILQGRNPYNIEHLRDFMEMTFKLFEIQGMTENIDALEFYSKVFMNVPICSPAEFNSAYGQESEICNFLSDFALDVFKLIIKNFQLIKYKDCDYGFVLPNLINIFWPYIANSSEHVLDQIIQLVVQYIDNDLTMADLNALGDLIDCLMFRTDKLMPHIIQSVMDKLLKPGKPKSHYLDFLIGESPYRDYIMGLEPTAGNKNSRLLWLTLLEKSLTYAGRQTQKFDKELHAIAILYLFDEEDEVFMKVSDIIHTTILANQIIKPTDLGNRPYFSSKPYEKQEVIVNHLKIDWQLPSKEDWEYVFRWNNLFMHSVKNHFEKNFLQNYEHYTLPEDFPKLVEQMIFRIPPMDPKLKSQCFRLLFLIFGSFTGSSLFVPFQPQHLDMEQSKGHENLAKFQRDYLQRVCPEEYFSLRQDLGQFVIKSVCFAISSGIAHDKDINDLLITIASECVSCQVLQQELQLGREFLEGCRSLNQAGQAKLYFDSRIQLVIDANTYLYQRHMFLMQLQAIPMEYNQIYGYIFVLYLLGQSEFTNPAFLLPYSKESTYILTTGLREIFFNYLLGLLDHNNPDSKLSKINQSQDKSKDYKQLQDLLTGFNSAVQHISTDIGISMKLQLCLNQFISIMDQIENQQCKNLIIESCVHHLAIQYDENTVVSENDDAGRLAMIASSTLALHSNLNWKCKIIHALSMINNINIAKQVPLNCIPAVRQLCIDDHMSLNQLGRATLFYFLRMAKQEIYAKTVVPPQLNDLPLEFPLFLQHRFITRTQLQKVDATYHYLRTIDDILDCTQPLYRSKMHEKYIYAPAPITQTTVRNINHEYIQQLRSFLTDPHYMKLFLDKILVDKDVASSAEFDAFPNEGPSQEVQFMSVQGITKYVQIFFAYIYAKNKVRQSPFSTTQSYFMSDFYFRLFKKIFQVAGIKAFHATKPVIDEYLKEFENKEKQRLVSCYLTALHRSLLNVGNYIQECFNQVLPLITQEIFYDYHLAFYYMCRDQDWQYLAPVYLNMLSQCKQLTTQGGYKGLRFIQLFKIIVQSQGPRAIPLEKDGLQYFESIIPIDQACWPSSLYVEEYTCTLATALFQSVLVPVPKEMGFTEKSLFEATSNFQIWYSEELRGMFSRINKFLRSKNTSQLKNYQELAARLLEYLAINKFDKHSWGFVVESIKIIFENSHTEIDSQEVLRKFIESDYEDSSELVEIAVGMTKHEVQQIRKRANWFLRDWYFRSRLEGGIGEEIPEGLLNMFDDKNVQLQMQAVTSLADYLRLFDKESLERLFEKQQLNRVYVLMAMLLSRQDRNYSWTNQALSEVFQLKKRKLLQEFVGEYWKCRSDYQLIFEETISERNVAQLKEIVNPHEYYA